MKVSKTFRKGWSSKKGKCPSVVKVLAIVNPALEDTFEKYKESLSLPWWHLKAKKYFHGTSFKCSLDQYQTPCQDSEFVEYQVKDFNRNA